MINVLKITKKPFRALSLDIFLKPLFFKINAQRKQTIKITKPKNAGIRYNPLKSSNPPLLVSRNTIPKMKTNKPNKLRRKKALAGKFFKSGLN